MLHAMLFVMLSWLAPWHPPPDPGRYGAFTDGSGWTYQLTKSDTIWFEKTLFCEAGTHIPGPEADAVAWTLVQRFYLDRHKVRTFGGWLTSWSQCVGWKWSSAGTKRTDRDIVAWVDYIRAMRRENIPLRARWFVSRFMRGEVPNRHPGWVDFLTCGYERHREPGSVGPFYVSTREGPCNVYYQNRRTLGWYTDTVKLLPAPRVEHPLVEALREMAGPPAHEAWRITTADRTSSTR